MDGPAVDRLAEIRARSLLHQLGVAASEPVHRLSSVTNEVWCSGELIVRINRRADGRLTQEVTTAARLPAEIGYPEIVDSGTTDGMEWMATRRLPGVALSRVWPRIDDAERKALTEEFAERLQILHQTDATGLAVSSQAPQLVDFHRPDRLGRLRQDLTRAYQLPHVPKSLMMAIAGMVEDAAPQVESVTATTLVHGDLTFENVLYHQGRIQAILDFEWARAAPPDLDLDVLLRFVWFPKLHVAPDYVEQTTDGMYRMLPRQIEAVYPELFAPAALLDRLLVYSIGFDVRDLLRFPPTGPMDGLGPHHPLVRLRNTAERWSHLHQLTR
ncbi:MAG: phosphotransferase family protein [Acidimicrobiales bacterium]